MAPASPSSSSAPKAASIAVQTMLTWPNAAPGPMPLAYPTIGDFRQTDSSDIPPKSRSVTPASSRTRSPSASPNKLQHFALPSFGIPSGPPPLPPPGGSTPHNPRRAIAAAGGSFSALNRAAASSQGQGASSSGGGITGLVPRSFYHPTSFRGIAGAGFPTGPGPLGMGNDPLQPRADVPDQVSDREDSLDATSEGPRRANHPTSVLGFTSPLSDDLSRHDSVGAASVQSQRERPAAHHTTFASVESADPMDGMARVNQYLLLEHLGAGAQGEVHLAEDTQLLEQRAIKIVRRPRGAVAASAVADAAALQRNESSRGTGIAAARHRQAMALQREVTALRKCRHKNIVALYEVIDDPGQNCMYLVMQYVDRGPVAKMAPGGATSCGALDCVTVTRYARQLCAGLQYLHDKGIVHRDIKPDNVLVDSDGAVFLSDFGMAELFDRSRAAVAGTRGTVPFMAPELLRDECGAGDDDGAVDGKALDVWALGLTFYVLLFGKMPWSLEGSRRDLIDQIVDTDIKVPRPPVVYPPDMAPSQRDAFDESFAAVAGGTDSVAMSPRLPLDREHHRAVSATRPGSDEELPDAATLVTGLLEHPTAGLDSPALTSDTSSKQVVGGTDPLTFVPSSAHPLGSSPGLASGVVDAPVLTNSGRSARGLNSSSGNGWGLPNLQGDCIGATAGSRPLTTTSSAPRSPAANNASRDIATRWQRLLQRMLRRDPAKRPAISEVRTLCRRIAKRAATASDFAAQSMVIDSMACSPLANRDL